MSGTDIVGALLRADAPVTTLVPAKWIKAGRLPDGVPLPALVIRTISVIERHMLKRAGWERVIARISVTVRAADYRDQCLAMSLVRDCCAGRVGTIAGSPNVSILTAGRGPDVDGPTGTFEQAQDFRVSFDAPV